MARTDKADPPLNSADYREWEAALRAAVPPEHHANVEALLQPLTVAEALGLRFGVDRRHQVVPLALQRSGYADGRTGALRSQR